MKSDRGRFDNRDRPSQTEFEENYRSAPASQRGRKTGAGNGSRQSSGSAESYNQGVTDDDDFDLRARRRRRAHRDAENFDRAAHTGPGRRDKAPRQIHYPESTAETDSSPDNGRWRNVPPDIAAAAAARSRAARHSRRKNWRRFGRTLGGIVAVCLVAFLLTAPQFKIATVSIVGDPDLPTSTALAVQNAIAGQNVFRARFGAARHMLTSLPPVRGVSMDRAWTWPPAVHVTIETRRPFARVGGGDVWWVADKEGVPFRPAGPDDAKLYAVAGPAFQPKLGVAIDAKRWQPVVEFADAMSQDAKSGQSWNLRRVYFDRGGFASLRLAGGDNDETLVQLGVGDWPQKLKKARWALADFARSGKHAAVLNLISSDVTTWTPRLASASGSSGKKSSEPTQDDTAENSAPTNAVSTGNTTRRIQ